MSIWIIILAILGAVILTLAVIWFIVVGDVKGLVGDPKKRRKDGKQKMVDK